MKITSIVENTSKSGLPVEHGLSLYIQMDRTFTDLASNTGSLSGARMENILFDMGQRRLFAENAARLGLCIADIDIAIIVSFELICNGYLYKHC